MKVIVAGVVLDSLVQNFARRFPGLASCRGAFGRCKFMSYELALFLRRRGVKAQLVHVQGLEAKSNWLKTAHATWQQKPRAEWSHYVVVVGSQYIDMTARQFDRQLPFPLTGKRSDLKGNWQTVETDDFINRIIDEVLKAQTDANRSLREGQVRKTNTSPQGATKLRPPAQQTAKRG